VSNSLVPVIDIAYYQGDVNFEKVRDSGIAGVIARASDGWRSGPDPRWHEYAKGTVDAGLPLGSYWYLRPVDGNETARDQARRWAQYVREAPGTRFLMLDSEWYWSDKNPAIDAAKVAVFHREMIEELRKQLPGLPIICYSSGPYWNGYVRDPALASTLDFVLARYPRNNTPPPSNPAEWAAWALGTGKRPALPNGVTAWSGWQFTSSLFGPDVGIQATRVDANVIRPEKWSAWIGETVEPDPPPVSVPAPDPAPTPAPAPAPTPTPPKNRKVYTVNVTLPQLSKKSPKSGPVSTHVKAAQSLLNAKSGAGLKEDGKFGPVTDKAVRNWQGFFNLTVDGVIGPITGSGLVSLPLV